MFSEVEERLLREVLMARLAERVAVNGGSVSRAELSDFPLAGMRPADRHLEGHLEPP